MFCHIYQDAGPKLRTQDLLTIIFQIPQGCCCGTTMEIPALLAIAVTLRLVLYDVGAGFEECVRIECWQYPKMVAFSPDNRMLAIPAGDMHNKVRNGGIQLWDIEFLLRTKTAHKNKPMDVCPSQAGNSVRQGLPGVFADALVYNRRGDRIGIVGRTATDRFCGLIDIHSFELFWKHKFESVYYRIFNDAVSFDCTDDRLIVQLGLDPGVCTIYCGDGYIEKLTGSRSPKKYAVNPAGTEVIASEWRPGYNLDLSLHTFDIKNRTRKVSLRMNSRSGTRNVSTLGYCGFDTKVLVGFTTGAVEMWNLETETLEKQFVSDNNNGKHGCSHCAYCPRENFIAVSFFGCNEVWVLDAVSGLKVIELDIGVAYDLRFTHESLSILL
jgi:WD40 repeat protein